MSKVYYEKGGKILRNHKDVNGLGLMEKDVIKDLKELMDKERGY